MTKAEYLKFQAVLKNLPGHVIEFPELNMPPQGEPITLVLYSKTFLTDDFKLSGVINLGDGARYLGTTPEAARNAKNSMSGKDL